MNEQDQQMPKMPDASESSTAAAEGSVMRDPEAASPMGSAVVDDNGRRLMTEPPPSVHEGVGEAAPYPDMVAAEEGAEPTDASSFAATEHGEGYVRLDVHVSGGAMTVTNAAVIDGSLVTDPDLTGDMVYQVLVGERQVAAEAMTELGYAIGLPPPDDESRGHHFAKIEDFDFSARIPRGDIALSELPQLQIELFRPAQTTQLSSDLPTHRGQSLEQAAAEAGNELPEVVARLDGLEMSALPAGAAEALRSKLR